MFGADWSIFVDAKSVNKKIVDGRKDGRTDVGRSASDHNSSLSTQCSAELINENKDAYKCIGQSGSFDKKFQEHLSVFRNLQCIIPLVLYN